MMKHVNPLYVLARGTRLHSLSHTVAKIHTRIQLQEGLFITIINMQSMSQGTLIMQI